MLGLIEPSATRAPSLVHPFQIPDVEVDPPLAGWEAGAVPVARSLSPPAHANALHAQMAARAARIDGRSCMRDLADEHQYPRWAISPPVVQRRDRCRCFSKAPGFAP